MRPFVRTLLAIGILMAPIATTCVGGPAVPFSGKIETTVRIIPTSEPWGLNIVVAGSGNVSHMGNVRVFLVEHALNPEGSQIQSSDFEITASNGDRLFAHFTMDSAYAAPPAGAAFAVQFSGTFYIDGGTGRFVGAAGAADFSGAAVVYPPDANHTYMFGDGEFSWRDGTLILKN